MQYKTTMLEAVKYSYIALEAVGRGFRVPPRVLCSCSSVVEQRKKKLILKKTSGKKIYRFRSGDRSLHRFKEKKAASK